LDRLFGPQDFALGFASVVVISMAYGIAPMVPTRMLSVVPSGSTMISLQLLGFFRADFAILDPRFPATWKCLAPPDLAQIPFPSQCVVPGF